MQQVVLAQDDTEQWILNTGSLAEAHAGLAADPDDLTRFLNCLREKLGRNVTRHAAAVECNREAQLNIKISELSGNNPLAAIALVDEAQEAARDVDADLARRAADASRAAAAVLEGLRRGGATPGQLAAAGAGLEACMRAWGTIAPPEVAISVCEEELEDFRMVRSSVQTVPDPQVPVVRSLGCPDDMTIGVAFTCNPIVEGPTTGFAWNFDGGAFNSTSMQQIPLTLNDSNQHTLIFRAFNSPGNAAEATDTVQATLPAPIPGSPGCPATGDPGATVTCSPSGFTSVDVNTNYRWAATGGSFGSIFDATFQLTLPADGSTVTVTLYACNQVIAGRGGQPKCSPTVGQNIDRTPPLGAPQGTISCSPTTGPARLDVFCTPNLTNTNAQTTKEWTAPGALSTGSNVEAMAVSYDTPGTTNTVTLRACNGTACITPSAVITVDAGAPPVTIACSPLSGQFPVTVNCTATGGGIGSVVAFGWSTTGTIGGAANTDRFSTTFNGAGTHSVTLRACIGQACTTQSAAVNVTAAGLAPTGSITCGPLTLFTGERITCSSSLQGNVTATNWSAPGGNPGAGNSSTFATAFDTTGTQTITLQVCNGTSCANLSPASVTTMRRPEAAAPTAIRPPPMAITGPIEVREQDVNCDFSVMPSSTGTISMNASYGANPTDLVVLSGTLQGAGSGTRTVRCGTTGTATQRWTASYSGNFSGGVDPKTGTVQVTGTFVVVHQSANYSDCKDNTGKELPCPPQPRTSASYPLTMTGTFPIGPNGTLLPGGSGGMTMQSGCFTSASWRVGS